MKHNITISADDLKKKLEATQIARLEKRFEFKGGPRRKQCYQPANAPEYCE